MTPVRLRSPRTNVCPLHAKTSFRLAMTLRLKPVYLRSPQIDVRQLRVGTSFCLATTFGLKPIHLCSPWTDVHPWCARTSFFLAKTLGLTPVHLRSPLNDVRPLRGRAFITWQQPSDYHPSVVCTTLGQMPIHCVPRFFVGHSLETLVGKFLEDLDFSSSSAFQTMCPQVQNS